MKTKRILKSNQSFSKWIPLIVLSSAMMIIIIDTTVLNVSISSMIKDLKTNVQSIQWVISAYSLTLAALTVTGGRMGDLFGRKKMFSLGSILFALGSLLTALAPTIAWVIIGNSIIEGVGAALMMPATSSLLVSEYKGKDRGLAFAVWGGVSASAAAIGPIVGGWLTTNYSWRWAFIINLFVVACLLFGSRFLRESREPQSKIDLDLIGIFLSSIGLVSVVYGLIESSTYGWGRALKTFEIFGFSFSPFNLSITPIAILLGVILLALFVAYELKMEKNGKNPLVSPELFLNKQFTVGSLTTMLQTLSMTGIIFSLPIFYQSVLGLDALHTGFGLLPMSLAVMVGAPFSLKLTHRFTPKVIIMIGLALSLIGATLLRSAFSVDATIWSFAPGLALFGVGMGFGFSQLSNLTLSAVSVKQSGEASGVNNTMRQVGSSFGSAVMGAILLGTLTSSVVSHINNNKLIPSQAKFAVIEQVKTAGSNIEFSSSDQIQNAPPGSTIAIKDSIHRATVDGNRAAMGLAIIFSATTLVFSILLPNIKNLETSEDISKAVSH
jgi:EmrB/QacA subfamily drug resistance transporter